MSYDDYLKEATNIIREISQNEIVLNKGQDNLALSDLGLSSLMFIQLIVGLEESFSISFDDEIFYIDNKTVSLNDIFKTFFVELER